MIYIQACNSCTLILNENNSLCIKIIDFDWSGTPSTIAHPNDLRYPPSLNPLVDWPGEPGRHINPGDDAALVNSWMNHWPPEIELVGGSIRAEGKLF